MDGAWLLAFRSHSVGISSDILLHLSAPTKDRAVAAGERADDHTGCPVLA